MVRSDFSKMEFNPFDTFGDTYIFKHYKRLGQVPVFSVVTPEMKALKWKGRNLSNLLGFVIIFIDTQSPMFDERDFDKRKEESRKVMKIDKDSVEWAAIEEENELFSEVVFEFFKLIHDADYEQWFTYKMQIHDFNKFLRKALTSDPKRVAVELNARKALMKELGNMKEHMQELEADIFDDIRLLQMISKKSTQNSVGSYAEKYAKLPEFHGKS